jgi:hypothetical protein
MGFAERLVVRLPPQSSLFQDVDGYRPLVKGPSNGRRPRKWVPVRVGRARTRARLQVSMVKTNAPIVGEYVKAAANLTQLHHAHGRRRALAALLHLLVGNKGAGPREHA